MKLQLQNPNRLTEKEQARRYRKVHNLLWKRIRGVLDGQEDRTWLVRQLAAEVVDELMDPVMREILDPELTWNATISRKGYTITVKPKEGRAAPILGD